MADQQNCFSLLLQLLYQSAYFLNPFFIQTVKRLVQDKNIRVFHNGLGNPQTLAHTKRIFPHVLFQIRVKPHLADSIFDVTIIYFSVECRQDTEIFHSRHVRQKTGAFYYGTNIFRKVHIPANLLSPDENLSGIRNQKTADAFQQNRLTTSVISDQAIYLPGL